MTPTFDSVWNGFPDHNEFATMGDLYRSLGGTAEAAIQWEGFGENGNTCASRMSAALNAAGFPIDPVLASQLGLKSLRTATGEHIIFRVSELRKYLFSAYGTPDSDSVPPFGDLFSGRRGVVAFIVQGWSDATGHFALFDGENYREPDHDDIVSNHDDVSVVKMEFWVLR